MRSTEHDGVAAGITITDMHLQCCEPHMCVMRVRVGDENNKKNHSHHHGQSHCLMTHCLLCGWECNVFGR
jgi:hypothetical protein